jgi:hypothetical protein
MMVVASARRGDKQKKRIKSRTDVVREEKFIVKLLEGAIQGYNAPFIYGLRNFAGE